MMDSTSMDMAAANLLEKQSKTILSKNNTLTLQYIRITKYPASAFFVRLCPNWNVNKVFLQDYLLHSPLWIELRWCRYVLNRM